MEFMNAYKHLEKLCGDILNDERRISAYIDEMAKISDGSTKVHNWDIEQFVVVFIFVSFPQTPPTYPPVRIPAYPVLRLLCFSRLPSPVLLPVRPMGL